MGSIMWRQNTVKPLGSPKYNRTSSKTKQQRLMLFFKRKRLKD